MLGHVNPEAEKAEWQVEPGSDDYRVTCDQLRTSLVFTVDELTPSSASWREAAAGRRGGGGRRGAWPDACRSIAANGPVGGCAYGLETVVAQVTVGSDPTPSDP